METVFALDIGTRVVIGLIMKKTDNGYEIIASARTEHQQRAMYDGQVHDVEEVAKAVRKIKNELELKTKCTLKKVAAAAAGRALRTETASVVREEFFPVHWEQEEVLALEMEAVQKAMKKLDTTNKENGNSFYCVGYNTIQQFLEDEPIGSLLGQRGRKAELSVIATFLPRTVVDGLLAVLDRVNLEMESLNLEPIAAGQVAIPADMRRLNLALVDIGAGTADIALTKDGSYFSYGMVPIAGDEVTETICSYYLLDFQEGERVKRELAEKTEIVINNFFGEKTTVPHEEVLELIRPTVQNMAEKISREIMRLNKRLPQAVILIGGGSLTPLLKDYLSEIMELPLSRIGIQIRERLSNVFGEVSMTGSDVITPIGIGIAALEGKGLHYYTVKVNDVSVPIVELQMSSVAEALLAAGIQPRCFLGRPGSALIVEVNGEMKVIKGGMGTPAKLFVNGQPASLDQKLHPGDCIKFIPGKPGKDAQAQIKDIFPIPDDKKIYWNGQEELFSPKIWMNEKSAQPSDWLEDGCRITIEPNDTLERLLSGKGLSLNNKKIEISINGRKKEIAEQFEVKINGEKVTENCIINNKDRIDFIVKKTTVKDLNLHAEPMNFLVNGKEFLLPPRDLKVYHKGKELNDSDAIEDGMELRIYGFSKKPILSELFPYLSLTENIQPGAKLQMSVNGKKAEFTTELNPGDRIIVRWLPEKEENPVYRGLSLGEEG